MLLVIIITLPLGLAFLVRLTDRGLGGKPSGRLMPIVELPQAKEYRPALAALPSTIVPGPKAE